MIEFRPIRVAVDGEDDGRLVCLDGRLVGVLTHLATEFEGQPEGWFLEAGIGDYAVAVPPVFASLNEAALWFEARRREVEVHARFSAPGLGAGSAG